MPTRTLTLTLTLTLSPTLSLTLTLTLTLGRLIFHGEGPLHVLAVNGRSMDEAEVVEKIAIDCLRTFRRAIAERKISPNELVSPRQWEDAENVKLH